LRATGAMKTYRFAAGVLALVLPTACGANPPEGEACTLLGCTDGYQIDFHSTSGKWPTGSYEIALELDGAKVTCSVAIPFKSAGDPGASCSTTGAQLGTSGSALPVSEQSLTGVLLFTHPKKVKLTVSRDGTTLCTSDLTELSAHRTERRSLRAGVRLRDRLGASSVALGRDETGRHRWARDSIGA
jgi:hypothetical protein